MQKHKNLKKEETVAVYHCQLKSIILGNVSVLSTLYFSYCYLYSAISYVTNGTTVSGINIKNYHRMMSSFGCNVISYSQRFIVGSLFLFEHCKNWRYEGMIVALVLWKSHYSEVILDYQRFCPLGTVRTHGEIDVTEGAGMAGRQRMVARWQILGGEFSPEKRKACVITNLHSGQLRLMSSLLGLMFCGLLMS